MRLALFRRIRSSAEVVGVLIPDGFGAEVERIVQQRFTIDRHNEAGKFNYLFAIVRRRHPFFNEVVKIL